MSATVVGARLLEWDSAFWGFRIAEVPYSAPVPDDVPARFYQTLHPVEAISELDLWTGTCWTPVDVRVTLDAPVVRGLEPAAGVRFYEENDLEHLVRIARESHRITRYYADPGFPDDRCHDLYETWIRNSVAGWADLVLVTGHPAHGYVTVHVDGDTGSIGLIAVDEQARGQGAGYRLVHSALRLAYTAGATRMTVVTQGRNIAAQRLFQRCGFRTSKTEVWLHKWYR